MRQAFLATLTLALLALLNGAPAAAGATAGTFAVDITLGTPGSGSSPVLPASAPAPMSAPSPQLRSGTCYSRSMSEQTGARVEVMCSSGQFVSIEAMPRAAFLDAHPGSFGPLVAERSVWAALAGDGSGWKTGSATITMLRLYDTSRDLTGGAWADRPVEVRVSF